MSEILIHRTEHLISNSFHALVNIATYLVPEATTTTNKNIHEIERLNYSIQTLTTELLDKSLHLMPAIITTWLRTGFTLYSSINYRLKWHFTHIKSLLLIKKMSQYHCPQLALLPKYESKAPMSNNTSCHNLIITLF